MNSLHVILKRLIYGKQIINEHSSNLIVCAYLNHPRSHTHLTLTRLVFVQLLYNSTCAWRRFASRYCPV